MATQKRISKQHGGVEAPRPSRLLTEGKTVSYRDVAESQAVVMSAALHRWADWLQKRYADIKYAYHIKQYARDSNFKCALL